MFAVRGGKVIGIDIGSKFIKVCKIVGDVSGKNAKKADGENQEKTFSVFSAMRNVSDLENVEKSDILKSLLGKLGIEKEKAFLAVGGKDLLDKNIFLSDEDGSISEEAKNEAIADFEATVKEEGEAMYITKMPIKGADKKVTNIICSAAPKDIVDNKLNIASVNGISIRGVTMETVALANAFEVFGPDYKNKENIILVNIGSTVTNIVVLKAGKLIYFKDIDFGGQSITKEIADTYGIKDIIAEEVKVKQDLKEKIGFYMPNILKKAATALIENIFTSIEYCVNSQFVISIERIVITGGGSLTEGLDSFVEKTMGIPTVKWNPLENNKFAGYTDKECGYFLPVSLGLALEKEHK